MLLMGFYLDFISIVKSSVELSPSSDSDSYKNEHSPYQSDRRTSEIRKEIKLNEILENSATHCYEIVRMIVKNAKA